jgi:hypothetical protein
MKIENSYTEENNSNTEHASGKRCMKSINYPLALAGLVPLFYGKIRMVRFGVEFMKLEFNSFFVCEFRSLTF